MSHIFNVRGTAAQKALIDAAVAATRWDSHLMLPGLKRQAGKDQIDVYFRPLGRSIGGTASTNGVVEINTSLSDLSAQQVFVMEGFAHCSDFFYLTDAQRRQIYDLFHPGGKDGHSWFEPSSYWNQVGEGLMDLFVWAFTPWRTQNSFVHKPTEAIAAQLPAVYGGTVPPPVPPVPPPPKPPLPPVPPHGGGFLHDLLDHIFGRHGGEVTASERAAVAAIPIGVLGTLLPLIFQYAAVVVPVIRAGIAAGKSWPQILKDVLAAVAAAR